MYHFDSGPARLREGPGRRVSFWGLPERGLPDLKEIYRGLFGWDLQGYRGRADQVVVSQVTCVLSVLHTDSLMCDRRRSTGSPSSMSELVRRQFSGFLARAVYFCKLELAELHGSGQKLADFAFRFFDPSRIFLQARAR